MKETEGLEIYFNLSMCATPKEKRKIKILNGNKKPLRQLYTLIKIMLVIYSIDYLHSHLLSIAQYYEKEQHCSYFSLYYPSCTFPVAIYSSSVSVPGA